jgi:hypothetical protein
MRAMGFLECRGRRCLLGADQLIGREPSAALRFDDDSVSWRHASLRWTGQAWELQDLGSLNGTFVDGQRVPAGTRALLRVGSRIRFGNSLDEWEVGDVSAPATCVVDLDSGERWFALDELIALPSPESPELFLSRQGSGDWVAEHSERVWEPQPLEVLTVGARRFRFEPGLAVNATRGGAATLVKPGLCALEFVVSRNEEYVELTIRHGQARIPLRPRSHLYLLLTLARLRVRDQADPAVGGDAEGWVYRDQLVKMLGTSATQLAVDVYRVRKQFSDAGVTDAAQIVERRGTSHELRIGCSQLEIRSLSSES